MFDNIPEFPFMAKGQKYSLTGSFSKAIYRYSLYLHLHVRAAKMAPNGYDCNFLSEPDDALKCPICLYVARDPRQHEECGKLFCSECIEKYGVYKPCPNCRRIGAHFYKDHRSKYKGK